MHAGKVGWAMLLFGACSAGTGAESAAFEPIPAPEHPERLGGSIQRTMALLATSTPERRNRVRILFYGQSVTRNPWWQKTAQYLRETYPHADLEIENRAIGGYSAPTLIHTAEFDLYPYYPDLMIFHVYGGVNGEQEELIRRVRQRTTSEVLLWTSHFRWPRDLPRDGSPDDPGAQKLTRADEERSAMIRTVAGKYGCELAEVREGIRAYLKQHGLYPKDTLRDSVHPNELGNFLIGGFIRPYLRYDPAFPVDTWKSMVRDIPADGPDVKRGADGVLEIAFNGNRIDVIAAHGSEVKASSARVLIDGKAPSEFPELYYHGRPNNAPHDHVRPAINRIDSQSLLVQETWTAKIAECDPEKNVLRYEVSGSVTGPDGQGDHLKKFVSNSGRVVIDARKWMVCWAVKYRKKPLPPDYQVTWETKTLLVDVYRPPLTEDPAKEYATRLAQGLSNGSHTLTLIPNGVGPVPIKAFRVYRPPVK